MVFDPDSDFDSDSAALLGLLLFGIEIAIGIGIAFEWLLPGLWNDEPCLRLYDPRIPEAVPT